MTNRKKASTESRPCGGCLPGQQQAAFIARGLTSRERARSTGRYVDAAEVLAALETHRAAALGPTRPA